MAIRVRSDGTMLCAAMHPEMPGDTYVDDTLHYTMSVEHRVLVTEPHEKHRRRGEWWWRNSVPDDVEVEDW
tara:strand:+ start:2231 stop:2443 length:213 start_codon:yes stop_codon:yes gene_type:complete